METRLHFASTKHACILLNSAFIGCRFLHRSWQGLRQAFLLSQLIGVCLLFPLASGVAYAHQSPINCGGGGLQMQLFKFHANGALASMITNGQEVIFAVLLQNNAQLFTPAGPVPVCDINGASVVLKIPDRQGNPNVTVVLATNLAIPFGSSPFYAGMITSVVDTASGVVIARVAASVTGVLHDVSLPGCPSDGDTVTNQCEPTLAFAQRSSALVIGRPALNISAQCVSATNNGSALSFNLSCLLTNSGDETLVNVSILSAASGVPAVLTNISSLPAGAAVSFFVSDTMTNYWCPVLSNRLIATGRSLATGSSLTAQDVCSIAVAADFKLHPPRRNPDGSVELIADCPQGWNYLIQVSTNLLDWSSLVTNTATAKVVSYVDTEAGAFRTRFYRIQSSCPE